MDRRGLRAVLSSGRFAVTAEIGPPRGADPEQIRRKAALLRDWVDAANVTDNQNGFVRLSSWAGSLLLLGEGLEPVMQMTCRDRNRLALQSDLLGAAALGIPNALLLTGDHPRFGDHPEAKPVFDLDSVQLTWAARTMRDEQRLLSGRRLAGGPDLFLGAVENPFAPPLRFRAQRLGKKVAAGAEFVQTQLVFDVDAFARWMGEVRDLGLDQRCKVLAGLGPIRSIRALEHMQTNVPGLSIPESVSRRLRGVPEDRVVQEGIDICVETIRRIYEISGISGVHLMAFGHEEVIPEILEEAGIRSRPRASRDEEAPADGRSEATGGPAPECSEAQDRSSAGASHIAGTSPSGGRISAR